MCGQKAKNVYFIIVFLKTRVFAAFFFLELLLKIIIIFTSGSSSTSMFWHIAQKEGILYLLLLLKWYIIASVPGPGLIYLFIYLFIYFRTQRDWIAWMNLFL